MMNSILFGKGYWASIVKEKIIGLTNLVAIIDSKTNIKIMDLDVDIAFICSSTSSHYDIVKRCLDNGIKYIFCTKPFTGDYNKAKELYSIAKQKDACIFVDNLFLYKEEIIKIQLKNIKNLFFYWEKCYLNDKENILDNLLYHDLYLLLKWSDSKEWKLISHTVHKDSVFLSMSNGIQNCDFEYGILDNKEKWIVLDDYVIDLSSPKNDPLKECVINILQGNVDYALNENITLETLKLLEYIKNKVYDK
jgi:hypothetical protein